jgi:putative ABC transport system permease protein
MTQQNAVFQGLLSWTTSHLRNMRASIWVVEAHVDYANETKPLRDTDVNRVRSVKGVDFAVPMYQGILKAKAADGSDKQIMLIGLHGATLFGRPPQMLAGSLQHLRLPNTVIIDELGVQRLSAGRKSPVKIGDTFEINDREARIVGICRTERHFFGYPYVFSSYDQALQYAPRQRKMLSLILAEPKPGVTPAEVAKNIAAETGLKAYTSEEFAKVTVAYIWKNTGIPMSFMTTIILGFIVGIAVSGQTFFSFVLENLRHLGALKAMGASTWMLARMLLLQAFTVGTIGYGIGVGLAALFGFAVLPVGQPPFLLEASSMIKTAVAIVIMCCFSAALGIRKVAKLEPAIVFRG